MDLAKIVLMDAERRDKSGHMQRLLSQSFDQRLVDLAAEYYRRTEEYDRTVCTGPIRDGSIMPSNHQQMAAINRNAIKVRRDIAERAASMGFTDEQLKEVMKHYARSC